MINNQKFRLWTDFTAWLGNVRTNAANSYFIWKQFSFPISLSKKVILASQLVFGIFPVSGLRHKNSSQLSFKMTTFSFFFSSLVQCGIVVMFSASIFKQLNSRIEYTKVGKSSDFLQLYNKINDSNIFYLQSNLFSFSSTFWFIWISHWLQSSGQALFHNGRLSRGS